MTWEEKELRLIFKILLLPKDMVSFQKEEFHCSSYYFSYHLGFIKNRIALHLKATIAVRRHFPLPAKECLQTQFLRYQ